MLGPLVRKLGPEYHIFHGTGGPVLDERRPPTPCCSRRRRRDHRLGLEVEHLLAGRPSVASPSRWNTPRSSNIGGTASLVAGSLDQVGEHLDQGDEPGGRVGASEVACARRRETRRHRQRRPSRSTTNTNVSSGPMTPLPAPRLP